MKKKYSRILIAFFIILSTLLPITVQAAEVNPRWIKIALIEPELFFYNNTGYLTTRINCTNDTTNITATARLYYKNASGSWIDTNTSWSYDVDDSTLTAFETFSAVSGREYKVEVEVYATANNFTEHGSDIATGTCN